MISRDLSERCICAKFASYLERAIAESEFCEYVVDVEYNRGSRGNEHAAKVLNGHNIVVDLIVHKRGYDEQRGFNNLFCIEMKKAYKRCDLSSDKERLRILTDNFCGFGYKAGFMITATADKIHDEYKLVVESAFYNHSKISFTFLIYSNSTSVSPLVESTCIIACSELQCSQQQRETLPIRHR